jgi:hypothetical protein
MPTKKKKLQPQPPPRKVVKTDFFVHQCHQQFENLVPVIKSEDAGSTPSSFPPPREQRRFFIYNKETGEPYAEWINNVAICLETGEELFKSRSYYEDQDNQQRYMDYSVPTYYREDDPTIYTADLIGTGIITKQDLVVGNGALTKEKYTAWRASRSSLAP